MTLFAFFATFFIGIISSFYGVSMGGGGLLVVPVMIFLGLGSKEAIATATLASIMTSAIGMREFKKYKKIDLKLAFWASIEFGTGALIGSLILINLPVEPLKKIVAGFLISLLIISLINPKIGLKKIGVSTFKKILGHVALFFNGIYKGMIHSGAAILKNYIFIYLFGKTYLESSGTRKLPALVASLISIFIFIKADLINWNIGLVLMAGHLIGSYLGANYALKKGEVWMKYAFTVMVGISILELVSG